MSWVRIDENAVDHPKIGGLHDGAFRLWVSGLAYCQKFLTDGYISDVALRGLRGYHVKRKSELVAATLWESVDTGIWIHDYLQWNESKASVMEARQFAAIKMALVRNPMLRKQIQERDGNTCHYCGCTVYWNDRKGLTGGTYDHVVPEDGDTLDNLVVACRGCATTKGDKTPEQAGIEDPDKSRFRSRLSRSADLDKSGYNTTPHHTTVQKEEEEREGVDAFFNARLAEKTETSDSSEQFGQAWNEATSDPIASCSRITAKRRRHIHARLAERPLTEWLEVFRRIQGSQFCRGVNDRGWLASFEWVIGSADVAVKVLEGKYDDRSPAKKPKHDPNIAAAVDWYEECGQMHNHACELNRHRHMTRMMDERAKAAS